MEETQDSTLGYRRDLDQADEVEDKDVYVMMGLNRLHTYEREP